MKYLESKMDIEHIRIAKSIADMTTLRLVLAWDETLVQTISQETQLLVVFR